MRWLLVFLCVGAAVSNELQCDPPLCSVIRSDYKPWLKFNIKGDTVEMNYTQSYFYVNCHKWQALDSLAMPRFTNEFSASTVVLVDCPLPATSNGSLVQALAALNVTLQPTNGDIYLKMLDFPSEPQLAPHYFSGFEHLTNLSIKSLNTRKLPEAPAGLFAELPSLRSLELRGVRLPAGELYRLPRTLKSLDLTGMSTEILPDTLQEALSETNQALPDLLALTLQLRGTQTPDSDRTNKNSTAKTKLQTNATSLLEKIRLYFWKQSRLPALQQCDHLRSFGLSKSFSLMHLPDRFISACPLVEELEVDNVFLYELPAKLLEDAAALKRLYLRNCQINSLPEGFFQGAPNLIEIDLSHNNLNTLQSGAFLDLPRLRSLSLRHNQLNNTVLNDLARLTSVTALNLASNQFSDFCDDNGYSPLSNLTQLRQLDVSYNDLNLICRDWRENLTLLDTLSLNSYKFLRLMFTDFQYIRDASVKNSIVNMEKFTIQVIFTEDDYKTALTAPETGATLRFANKFMHVNLFDMDCGCSTYWLRRALDDASHAIKIEGLSCEHDRNFKDVTPEEMCPERTATTTSEKP